MIGAALYWAEGSKQKEHHVATAVIFSNSDPQMILFFYNWLVKICKIEPQDIYFELYIHENAEVEVNKVFWAKILNLSTEAFSRVRLKKNKGRNFRKNTGNDYHGVLRIVVRRSANMNRKIMGWVFGVCQQFQNYSGVV